MGLRLSLFALAFNALWWLSRLSLGRWAAAHASELACLVVSSLGPLCLLALAMRLDPHRRGAVLGVASVSLCVASSLAG